MIHVAWDKLASDKVIGKTIISLKERGIEAVVVKCGEDAKRKIIELIPAGAEVMNLSSTTLEQAGINWEIMESGRYNSIKKKITSTKDENERHGMRRASATTDYAVGSVQAVTEDGQIVIVSNTGSQLTNYAYGSPHVIWVVGTQKIVKNLDEAFKRTEEYILPLESERLKKLYGVPSNISKTLIIEKEITPNRIKLIFVKEKLGF